MQFQRIGAVHDGCGKGFGNLDDLVDTDSTLVAVLTLSTTDRSFDLTGLDLCCGEAQFE